MGISVHPRFIIGIRLSEVVTIHNSSETFEVHDERGRPTGKMKTIDAFTAHAMVNGTEYIVDFKGFISSQMEQLLGVPESPRDGEFGFFNTDYHSDGLENFIIGISYGKIDAMYGEQLSELPEDKRAEIVAQVKEELKKFDLESTPISTFLYACVG